MIKIYKCIVLLICCIPAFGQDLVLLKNNDSLNCKILNQNNGVNIEIAMIDSFKNIETLIIDLKNITKIEKGYFVTKAALNTICFDTIYTKQNEVIVAHIIEDKKDWYISYELADKSKHSIAYGGIVKVVRCPQSSLTKFKENFDNSKPPQVITLLGYFENSKYRISLNALLALKPGNPRNSNNIVKLPKNYYDQQRFLYGLGAEFHRSINKRKNILIGVQLNQLLAGGTAANTALTAYNGTIYTGDLSSDLYLTSIGPNLIIKLGKNRKIHSCAIQLGLNWVFYNEKLAISNYNGSFYGTGFSQLAQFQYNYRLDSHLSFAANLGLNGGAINSVTLTENGTTSAHNLKGNQAITIGRASFSLGMVYSFK